MGVVSLVGGVVHTGNPALLTPKARASAAAAPTVRRAARQMSSAVAMPSHNCAARGVRLAGPEVPPVQIEAGHQIVLTSLNGRARRPHSTSRSRTQRSPRHIRGCDSDQHARGASARCGPLGRHRTTPYACRSAHLVRFTHGWSPHVSHVDAIGDRPPTREYDRNVKAGRRTWRCVAGRPAESPAHAAQLGSVGGAFRTGGS
jgi:hypothetical protein